jgi:hypothetical protein
MIATLSHDADTGRLWLEFPAKPDAATIAALKAGGWRWGSFRKAWYHPSRFGKVPAGVQYEEGGEVAYAAERADRLEGRAEAAEARSDAAFARAHQIADGIPFGQPILVGHHSERHARRDVERIHGAMSKGCEEQRKAERLAQAAAGSARAQAARHDPGAIGRRIAKMEKELAKIESRLAAPRDESGTAWALELRSGHKPSAEEVAQAISDWRAEAERVAGILRQDLSRAREELDAAGGIPADSMNLKPGDVVRVKGHVAKVVRVNRKTVTVQSVYMACPLKYDKGFVTEVISRAADKAA